MKEEVGEPPPQFKKSRKGLNRLKKGLKKFQAKVKAKFIACICIPASIDGEDNRAVTSGTDEAPPIIVQEVAAVDEILAQPASKKSVKKDGAKVNPDCLAVKEFDGLKDVGVCLAVEDPPYDDGVEIDVTEFAVIAAACKVLVPDGVMEDPLPGKASNTEIEGPNSFSKADYGNLKTHQAIADEVGVVFDAAPELLMAQQNKSDADPKVPSAAETREEVELAKENRIDASSFKIQEGKGPAEDPILEKDSEEVGFEAHIAQIAVENAIGDGQKDAVTLPVPAGKKDMVETGLWFVPGAVDAAKEDSVAAETEPDRPDMDQTEVVQMHPIAVVHGLITHPTDFATEAEDQRIIADNGVKIVTPNYCSAQNWMNMTAVGAISDYRQGVFLEENKEVVTGVRCARAIALQELAYTDTRNLEKQFVVAEEMLMPTTDWIGIAALKETHAHIKGGSKIARETKAPPNFIAAANVNSATNQRMEAMEKVYACSTGMNLISKRTISSYSCCSREGVIIMSSIENEQLANAYDVVEKKLTEVQRNVGDANLFELQTDANTDANRKAMKILDGRSMAQAYINHTIWQAWAVICITVLMTSIEMLDLLVSSINKHMPIWRRAEKQRMIFFIQVSEIMTCQSDVRHERRCLRKDKILRYQADSDHG